MNRKLLSLLLVVITTPAVAQEAGSAAAAQLIADQQNRAIEGQMALEAAIIWGTEKPEKPKSMDRRTLGRYKDELSKLERLVKGAKVNETQTGPIVYDSKKKRLELDSEKTRTIAQDLLKSLSAEIPK